MNEKIDEKFDVIFEDLSQINAKELKKMLGSEYVIHLAEDGLVGWEMLQQNTDISVIFTDLYDLSAR